MVFNLISFFSGFLTSSIIDTSLGEFSEWAIVGASLVVANIEAFNNFYYSLVSKNRNGFVSRRHGIWQEHHDWVDAQLHQYHLSQTHPYA